MDAEDRKTGIDIIGNIPWGTHLCFIYETQKDLVDILIPYFKAGLENNEFCMWVTSEPFTEEEVKRAMKKALPDFDQFLKKGQIEIIPYNEWYLKSGRFNSERVLNGWVEKHNQALVKGYEGLRLTGNMVWLEKKDWRDFSNYEEAINNVISNYRMLVICSYPLDKCGAFEMVDIFNTHNSLLIRKRGQWKVIENIEHKLKGESLKFSDKMKRLNIYLQSKRESEKTLVSKYIHDDIAQTLVALKMLLYSMNMDLPEGMNVMSERIQKVSEIIDKTVHRVKEIFTELRPSVLNHFGLVAAIQWKAEEFENRVGIKCKVAIGSERIDLDWDRSTTIFRIFQELLTNVERHAEATQVNIKLSVKDDKLELKVKDNGKGILEKQLADPKSFGIIEIIERVRSLGGEEIFKGVPNKGTIVTIRIPFKTIEAIGKQ
jgi:signal transduction histidine kinase